MEDIGIVEDSGTKPRVINSLFVDPKVEILRRLMVDTINTNEVFHPPPDPYLLNPELFADLHLPNGKELFFANSVAKRDLCKYYRRLRVPDRTAAFSAFLLLQGMAWNAGQ